VYGGGATELTETENQAHTQKQYDLRILRAQLAIFIIWRCIEAD
jgi:hypothetical protein